MGPAPDVNTQGFKWCWVPTRCKIYAVTAAVVHALEEGHRGPVAVRRRVLDLYDRGVDMFDEAPFRCVICRKVAQPNRGRDRSVRKLTLDHVVPLSSSRAKPSGRRNLLAVCLRCNSARGARPLRSWIEERCLFGVIRERPASIFRRMALTWEMPTSRTLAWDVARVFYPGFARSVDGRYERRARVQAELVDVPF